MTACKKRSFPPNHYKSKSPLPSWRWWDYLFFSFSLLAIVIACFYWQIHASNHSFAKETNLDLVQMLTLYQQATQISPKQNQGITNILLLGSDQMNYRLNNSPLCDTMIIASINWQKNQVILLPLPRDLALPGSELKINALYALHSQRDPQQALEKTAQQLAELLQIHFDYQIIVTLDAVADFLTLIDGVQVEVANSFTDYQFPRTDIDINNVFDPALLYETVSFAAGWQYLNPEMALKFIRSRHAQGIEGSDYARSRRQQLIIKAVGDKVAQIILAELKQYQFTFLAKLYQFYQQHFASQLEFTESLSLLIRILAEKSMPTIINQNLLINQLASSANLVEVNGRNFYIKIVNLSGLQAEIKQKLALP